MERDREEKGAVPVAFDEGERRLSKAESFGDLLLSFPAEAGDLIERRRKPARASSRRSRAAIAPGRRTLGQP